MDVQRNLRVLQKVYAAAASTWSGGSAFTHMQIVAKQSPIDETFMDTRALIECLTILQEVGFSDLYFNGRRRIGIRYGTVPLELEVWFTVDEGGVSSCRIGLYLRGCKKSVDGVQSNVHLVGQWNWDRMADALVCSMPLDMTKVLWGVEE